MHGWEAAFRIAEHPNGFGSVVAQTRGIYLEVDDDGLAYNQRQRERDAKIRRGRFVPPTTFSSDEAEPGGPLTFQPKPEDLIGILMSHFQCVQYEEVGAAGGIGTGTLTFIPIDESPDWTGTVWGTHNGLVATVADVYSVEMDKIYGHNLQTGANTNNGLALYNAVCMRMEFNQRLGEDLMVVAQMESVSGDPSASYGATYDPPAAAGSYSADTRFVDWQGTITFSKDGTGTTLELQEVNHILDNGQESRRSLGTKNRSRFPYSGRPIHEGNLQWEFDRTDILDDIVNVGSFNIHSRWYTDDLHWMTIEHSHAVLKDQTPQIPSGDSPVMVTQPFRAYPTSDGTPATILKVMTTFATSVFTFPYGEGTLI